MLVVPTYYTYPLNKHNVFILSCVHLVGYDICSTLLTLLNAALLVEMAAALNALGQGDI